jgi:hypothetical protein
MSVRCFDSFHWLGTATKRNLVASTAEGRDSSELWCKPLVPQKTLRQSVCVTEKNIHAHVGIA